jgi:4-hydroxymandelate oxidase
MRGANAANALMVVPGSLGATGIARLGALASCRPWLQFYFSGREDATTLINVAQEAGYAALCVTVDAPVPGVLERDERNSFRRPFKAPGGRAKRSAEVDPWNRRPFTWEDVDWLRDQTTLPIVLKGILTLEDAALAVDHGVQGIIVSNHGGRVLDSAPSSVEALFDLRSLVGSDLQVYLDSGIRRGSDVLKALALGARAVGIGRPMFWGLAVNGSEGVRSVLEILRDELLAALACCGQTSVSDIAPDLIGTPEGWRSVKPRRQREADEGALAIARNEVA